LNKKGKNLKLKNLPTHLWLDEKFRGAWWLPLWSAPTWWPI